MLSAIASDPTALPLWVVFLFAVAMYPLGLLLPGCPCCGGGNCSTCGSTSSPYESQSTGWGRMCCSGTAASTVTLRVTTTSAASETSIERGSPNFFGQYQKITRTFTCSSLDGDYVLNLSRSYSAPTWSCAWLFSSYGGSAGKTISFTITPNSGVGGVPPYTNPSWPDWYLFWVTKAWVPMSRKVQTCSGYPGPESCNIGTTSSWVAFFDGDMTTTLSQPANFIFGPFSSQACTPAARVFGTSIPFDQGFLDYPDPNVERGSLGPCRWKVEILA